MSLDDKVIYVFARQDLPVAKQIVHTNHAVFQMALEVEEQGIPSVIVIGMPDEPALHRVVNSLAAKNVEVRPWVDPNYPELGITAVCTMPVTQEERATLSCYRIYPPV